MRLFAIPVLCLALLPTAAPSQLDKRGKYFTFKEFEFEMWLPWGFHRSKENEGKGEYRFSGNTDGGRHMIFHETGATSLDLYVYGRKRYLDEECKGSEYKVHTDVKAGPVNAVIIVAQKLDAVENLKDTDLITAAMEIGEESIVELAMRLDKGKIDRGLEQVRWMLSTFKFAGDTGLDDFCLERRIHKETGLFFRPPRGFKPEKPKDHGRIAFAGENQDAGLRIEIKKSSGTRLRKALDEEVGDYKRIGRSILFPHPGSCKLLGALYTSGDSSRRRTIIAAEVEKGHFFTLRTDGATDRQESLVRTAELVAMSLGYLDVEKARREIEAAVDGLEEVLKKRQKDEIHARVEVLVPYPFMKAARTALADCLLAVRDAKLQLEVIKAIGSVKGGDVLPQLLRAVTIFKSRKQPDHVTAALKALAVVQGPKALPVLKKLATRGTNAQSAAAVQSLGHYGFERERALKDLVNLMAREEKAGRKPKVANRERWLVLKPAFQAALKTLTGEKFRTAAEAKAWMRRK